MADFHKLLFPLLITSALGSDDGVCVKTWKSVKTIRQSYIFTWRSTFWGYCNWERCRKTVMKSRVEYRIKYEDIPQKLEYCCNGYEKAVMEHHTSLVCRPRCIPNCISGICTAPGICTCLPGHKPSPYESNICEPICEPECVMGKCIRDVTLQKNICECKENYTKSSNHSHICEPVCSYPCQNGYCIKPEECHCYDGYKLDMEDKYKCLPQCDNCDNGECVQPYKCECHEGYSKANGICMPYCTRECINGHCTAPETCSCNTGFTKSEETWNICIPYCSNCVNSYCSAPETCTCYDGYTKENNNSNTCVPICSIPCEKGECIEPDVCQCIDGFKPVNNYTCEPDCSNDCINSNCTEPETCTCFNGYAKSEYEDNVCEPFCENGCLNGNCTLPNICTCDNDFIKVKHNVCMPICNEDCENNFNNCSFIPECVQIGKHFFSRKLHFTSNNAVINLKNAVMTLNWSCSDIFKNLNTNCTFDDCESCASLPLKCISEINFKDKHVDFICTKFEKLDDNYGNWNETDLLFNYDEEAFNYTITLIHPEELHGAEPGKCDVCICGTNLKGLHKQNEAQFYLTPCQKQNESLRLEKTPLFDYSYLIFAIILTVALIILVTIIFQIKRKSSSYGIYNNSDEKVSFSCGIHRSFDLLNRRKEQNDGQEITLDEELLVNTNNILEDD